MRHDFAIKRALAQRLGSAAAVPDAVLRAFDLTRLAAFDVAIPAFVATAEAGFRYRLMLGYDAGDPFFDTDVARERIHGWFHTHVTTAGLGIDVDLELVRVNNTQRKPGPVFNALARAALAAGADFLFRVNDDVAMTSPGWSTALTRALCDMPPPFGAGVVGPARTGGNAQSRLLVLDFTHRTHADRIFSGDYYPPALVDWWMDNWISRVYGPKRTRAVAGVTAEHRLHFHGRRYQVDFANQALLNGAIADGKDHIAAFIEDFAASISRGGVGGGASADGGMSSQQRTLLLAEAERLRQWRSSNGT